jgi:hypothetical protein
VIYLDVAYVCNGYVASVYSKCFICSRHMLQLFYLSIAKVYLNVGLMSEEERASAGVMAESASKLAAALHWRMHRVTSMLAHMARPCTTCSLR